MKIAVCVRRTPSTDTKIAIGGDGKSIDPSGVKFELNAYDTFAVEEALKTKEAHGGEVTAITVGDAESEKELKQALAMGVDAAVRIDAADADSAGIATLLSNALKDIGPDVVFCGKMAVDEQDFQVPLRLATLLEMPAVTYVSKIEFGDGAATVTSETEAGVTVYETPLPAVVAVDKSINEPRLPGIKGIMAAKKKKVETIAGGDAARKVTVESLALPPEKSGGKIVGEGADAVPELLRLLREEAKAL